MRSRHHRPTPSLSSRPQVWCEGTPADDGRRGEPPAPSERQVSSARSTDGVTCRSLQRPGHRRQLRRPRVGLAHGQRHDDLCLRQHRRRPGSGRIEIPPGAIVGLLDDFWQRSLANVGLLRFVNVARPRAPHRAAGMRPRRQPWVALHESGDRHSRTRHHHGVAPGWPIAHPLVAEGRAAVFWPNPAAIDFARHSARCTRPNSALISSLAASRRRRVTTNSGLPSIHSQKVSSL